MTTSRRTAILLILPAAVLLAALTIYPIGRSLALSLVSTDYGFAGAKYVGLRNYEDLLVDHFFLRAVSNTVWFTILATVSEVALGLALALLVNRKFPGRGVVITLLVSPFVLSTMVVTAIWSAWYHFDFGYLNNLLRVAGLEGAPWLFDPDVALYSLVLVDLWQTTPIAFLILLAGLQAIDPEVYEAARMDGAGPVLDPFHDHDSPAHSASLSGGADTHHRQLQDLRQGVRTDRRRPRPGDGNPFDVSLSPRLPVLRDRSRLRDGDHHGCCRGNARRLLRGQHPPEGTTCIERYRPGSTH